MTTRRTTATAGGLSTSDVDRIRSSLAAGRKPKVVFTDAAGQVAGQAGQVVELTDPEASDEWLVVRFGRDELPFSPADLSLPPRGRPARQRGPAEPGAPAVPGGSPAGPPPVAEPAPRAAAAEVRRPAKRAARPPRGARSPAPITVTLSYQAGEWTVAAQQGSRALAKPCPVRPAEALKLVSMLDVPGVHDAVEQIVTAELAEAQQRADTLRTELAEVEARLAELRGAG
jgi:hypothetical protein